MKMATEKRFPKREYNKIQPLYEKTKIKRSESFFGIHFDFHARESDRNIGLNTSEKMIENLIDSVEPDFIQIDAKGHRGISSYPTKVGFPAPGMKIDQLKLWREVTKNKGIMLCVHYSGLWDSKALEKNPDWGRVKNDGTHDDLVVSVSSPYADEILIPQLKEFCDDYQIDAVWIDGDAWAPEQEYDEKTIKEFQQETGINQIPKKPDDRFYHEFTEFCRQKYRQYLKYYINKLHEYNPDFEICVNGAFSLYMPESVSADVDFLSLDYLVECVNQARLQSRGLACQNKPWDLMAWSFTGPLKEECFSTKSIPQLKQEAAIVISQGGGLEVYFRQKRDASIMQWQTKLMAEVAKFCRARQKFCHKAKSVPQIGLYLSKYAYYKGLNTLFRPWNGELSNMDGILRILLDNQNSVDILMDHNIAEKVEQYPLIVFPEWKCLDNHMKQKLLAYVENGGNLLVIGPQAAKIFEKELNIKLLGQPEEKMQWLRSDGWLGVIKTQSQFIELNDGTVPFGKIYQGEDIEDEFEIPASIARYGKGKIAGVYLNLSRPYSNAATFVARDFLNSLVRKLFPDAIAEVKGSHLVDIHITKKDSKLTINLINTAGKHSNKDVYVFDEIPPIGPLEITIRLKEKPNKITLQPEDKQLDFEFNNRKAVVIIPQLSIHSILIVE